MVIDFTDFKRMVTDHVVNEFNHSLVLNLNSPHAHLKSLNDNFEKINFAPYQPSCENLLIDFINRINFNLPESVKVTNIKLEETPASFAEWFL